MKKLPIALALFGLVACATAQAPRAEQCGTPIRGWCPAEYRGLVTGRSTLEEVFARLGPPDSVDAPGPAIPGDSLPMGIYFYRDSAAQMVEVWASRPDDVVHSVVEYPRDMTRADLTRRFGSPGQEGRYDFDYCLGDGESAPVYESPDGGFVMIEYRSRGIAVLVNWKGEVDAIEYLSEPYGAAESACAGAEADTG